MNIQFVVCTLRPFHYGPPLVKQCALRQKGACEAPCKVYQTTRSACVVLVRVGLTKCSDALHHVICTPDLGNQPKWYR